MEQSRSWEINPFSVSQEIPRIVQNPKFHYAFHKCPTEITDIKSLQIKLLCCLPIFFSDYCNHSIVIRISFSEISYVKYVRMPSPIYKDMINLVVSLPIRRGPEGCATVSFPKRTALYKVIWAYNKFLYGIFKIWRVFITLGHGHANVL